MQDETIRYLFTLTSQLRGKYGKTAFAQEIGLSFPTFRKLEEAVTEGAAATDMTLDTFYRWCDVLNQRPEDVMRQVRAEHIIKEDEIQRLTDLEILHSVPVRYIPSLRRFCLELISIEIKEKHEEALAKAQKASEA